MSIKLIAVDIDGTLVNSSAKSPWSLFLPSRRRQAGVKIVIATGRPIAGVAKLLDDLKLRDEGDCVVTFNGALVQETATGHDYQRILTYEDYLDMEFLSRKLGVQCIAITKDGIFIPPTQYRRIHGARINPAQHAHLHCNFEEMADMKSSNVCLLMNQQFSMLHWKSQQNYINDTTMSVPFHFEPLKNGIL